MPPWFSLEALSAFYFALVYATSWVVKKNPYTSSSTEICPHQAICHDFQSESSVRLLQQKPQSLVALWQAHLFPVKLSWAIVHKMPLMEWIVVSKGLYWNKWVFRLLQDSLSEAEHLGGVVFYLPWAPSEGWVLQQRKKPEHRLPRSQPCLCFLPKWSDSGH